MRKVYILTHNIYYAINIILSMFSYITGISSRISSFFGNYSFYDMSFSGDIVVENEQYNNPSQFDRLTYEIHADNSDNIKSKISLITNKLIIELLIKDNDQNELLGFLNAVSFCSPCSLNLHTLPESIKFNKIIYKKSNRMKCNNTHPDIVEECNFYNNYYSKNDSSYKYIILSEKIQNINDSHVTTNKIMHISNAFYDKLCIFVDEYINKYESQDTRIKYDKKNDEINALNKKRQSSFFWFLF